MKNVVHNVLMTSLFLCLLTSCQKKEIDIEEIEIEEVATKIPADEDMVPVADSFENYLIEKGIDENEVPDGKVKYLAVKDIDSLDIYFTGEGKSLKGIEYFTQLKYLKFRGKNTYAVAFPGPVNGGIKSTIDTLDVSKNKNLEFLDCSGGSDGGGYWSSIDNLKFGNNSKLKTVICYSNMIKTLDISGLEVLETLSIPSSHQMTSLNLCNNKALRWLTVWTPLKTVYVSSMNQVTKDWSVGPAEYIVCK